MRAEHLLFISTDKHGTTTFKVTGGGFNMDTVENEYLNKYSPLIFISISIFLTTPAWLLNKLQLLTTSETHSGSETRSSESVSRLLSTDSDGDMKPSTQTEASFRSTETWSDPVFLPHSVSNAAGCFFFFTSTQHFTQKPQREWIICGGSQRSHADGERDPRCVFILGGVVTLTYTTSSDSVFTSRCIHKLWANNFNRSSCKLVICAVRLFWSSSSKNEVSRSEISASI